MPIRIACPSCAAVLTVPDTAAGKTGKCPKCQTPIAIPPATPEFEVVDEPAPPTPADNRPGSRRRSADAAPDDRPRGRRRDPDDRDEDEDDRPVSRRPVPGRKKAGGNGKVLILAVVGVAVLGLAAGGGIAAWFLLGKDAPAGAAGNGPPGPQPQGPKATEWTRFDGPDGIFTAYFPSGSGTPIDLVEKAADRFGPRTQTWTQRHDGRSYIATLWTWDAKTAGAANPDVVARVTGTKEFTAEALTTLGGRKARRYITTSGEISQALVSAGLGNGRSVMFTVLGNKGLTFEDPLVEQFFAKIELTAGSIPPPAVAPGEWPAQTLSIKAPALTISAPATLQVRTASGLPPKGATQRMWQAEKALVYTVIITSLDQPPAPVTDRDLDQLCDGFAATMKFGKEKTRAPVAVGGHPGRKMMFSSGGKDIYYRVTIVGSEVFTLTAVGRTPLSEDDPAVAKFFDGAKIK
ncbi:MAG: hypothetical protein JWO38_7236 [Gemmataceae bacterium]|nr:hypothetical protein [Gemmataceae bacterium]